MHFKTWQRVWKSGRYSFSGTVQLLSLSENVTKLQKELLHCSYEREVKSALDIIRTEEKSILRYQHINNPPPPPGTVGVL